MAPMVLNQLEKARQAAGRQCHGVPIGQRGQERPEFKIKPGGKVREESWLSAIPPRYLWWALFVGITLGLAACSFSNH